MMKKGAHLSRVAPLLVLLCALAMVAALAACQSSDKETDSGPQPTATSQTGGFEGDVGEDEFALTFNISLASSGFDPQILFIPAGRQVQIVLRSGELGEFHYKVEGMTATDVRWISTEEGEREADVTDDEHLEHHSATYVEWRATSASGIQPQPGEVHGYTQRGERDVIRFIATELGTFNVVDPLHPELSGQLIVY